MTQSALIIPIHASRNKGIAYGLMIVLLEIVIGLAWSFAAATALTLGMFMVTMIVFFVADGKKGWGSPHPERYALSAGVFATHSAFIALSWLVLAIASVSGWLRLPIQ